MPSLPVLMEELVRRLHCMGVKTAPGGGQTEDYIRNIRKYISDELAYQFPTDKPQDGTSVIQYRDGMLYDALDTLTIHYHVDCSEELRKLFYDVQAKLVQMRAGKLHSVAYADVAAGDPIKDELDEDGQDYDVIHKETLPKGRANAEALDTVDRDRVKLSDTGIKRSRVGLEPESVAMVPQREPKMRRIYSTPPKYAADADDCDHDYDHDRDHDYDHDREYDRSHDHHDCYRAVPSDDGAAGPVSAHSPGDVSGIIPSRGGRSHQRSRLNVVSEIKIREYAGLPPDMVKAMSINPTLLVPRDHLPTHWREINASTLANIPNVLRACWPMTFGGGLRHDFVFDTAGSLHPRYRFDNQSHLQYWRDLDPLEIFAFRIRHTAADTGPKITIPRRAGDHSAASPIPYSHSTHAGHEANEDVETPIGRTLGELKEVNQHIETPPIWHALGEPVDLTNPIDNGVECPRRWPSKSPVESVMGTIPDGDPYQMCGLQEPESHPLHPDKMGEQVEKGGVVVTEGCIGQEVKGWTAQVCTIGGQTKDLSGGCSRHNAIDLTGDDSGDDPRRNDAPSNASVTGGRLKPAYGSIGNHQAPRTGNVGDDDGGEYVDTPEYHTPTGVHDEGSIGVDIDHDESINHSRPPSLGRYIERYRPPTDQTETYTQPSNTPPSRPGSDEPEPEPEPFNESKDGNRRRDRSYGLYDQEGPHPIGSPTQGKVISGVADDGSVNTKGTALDGADPLVWTLYGNGMDGGVDGDDDEPYASMVQVSRCSYLSPGPDVERFCKLMGMMVNEFRPQDEFPINLPFLRKDARYRPKGYQVFYAWQMLFLEERNSIEADNGDSQQVGGILSLAPGFGKSLTVCLTWAFSLMVISVKSECQIRRYIGKRHGKAELHDRWKISSCACAPDGVLNEVAARHGATVVVVPPVILGNWKGTFENFFDLSGLSRAMGGTPVQIVIGHDRSKARNYPLFGNVRNRWVPSDITMAEEMELNRLESIEDWVESRMLESTEKVTVFDHHGTGLLILTTPLSWPSQVLNHIKTKVVPGLDPHVVHYQRCKADLTGRCIYTGVDVDQPRHPRKHQVRSNSYSQLKPISRVTLSVSRFFIDECHNIKSDNTNLTADLIDFCRRQSRHLGLKNTPTLWGVTGTPTDNHATDMLTSFIINDANGLMAGREDTRHYSLTGHLELRDVDCGIKDYYSKRLSLKTLEKTLERWLPTYQSILGKRDDLGQLHRDRSLGGRLEELWGFAVKPHMSRFMSRYAISLTERDMFQGEPLVRLPQLTMNNVHLKSGGDLMGRYLDGAMEQIRGLVDESVRSERGKVRILQRASRFLKMYIQVPYLSTIEGRIEYPGEGGSTGSTLHSATINAHKWFGSGFKRSPYWSGRQEIFDSSVKLQEMIRIINEDQPTQTTVAEVTDPSSPSGVSMKTFTHPRKWVIAATEPAVALAALYILRLKLGTVGNWETESIQAIHSGINTKEREKLIYQFQSMQPTEDNGRSIPQVHIMVLCTKVAGEGITLNASHRMIILDVDEDQARAKQVPPRIHRIGVSGPVTCFQLISGDFGVEDYFMGMRKMAIEKAGSVMT